MGFRCTNSDLAAIGWDKARCPFGHNTVPGVTDLAGYRLVEHDWSMFLSFQIRRPVNDVAGDVRYMFSVPNVVELLCFNNITNKFGALIYSGGTTREVYATFPTVVAANTNNGVESDPNGIKSDEWNLLCISYDATALQATAFGRTERLARQVSPQVSVALPGALNVLSAANFGVGRQRSGINWQPGSFGLLCIRDHQVGPLDFDDVWDSADPYAPYLLDNTGSSYGTMNGATGAVWMIGHGMLPNAYPVDNA